MPQIEIIKCHGSGNDFVMIDALRSDLTGIDLSSFVRWACCREQGVGSDGVLLLVRHDDGCYGMDMFNPDGTRAEMCGNGIRCVARLAYERGYLDASAPTTVLRSGGRDYRVSCAEDIAEGVAAYAVDIPIRTWSPDFSFFAADDSWVGRVVEEFDGELRFTALSLGNPHIVAEVGVIDLERLRLLGERVKGSDAGQNLFPRGVNVSLYERCNDHSIFVATYERGAGITLSCGTAMTASSTAAALLGRVEAGSRVEVRNRGGKVFCTTHIVAEDITTRLEGNATFDWWGSVVTERGSYRYECERRTAEDAAWQQFVRSVNECK